MPRAMGEEKEENRRSGMPFTSLPSSQWIQKNCIDFQTVRVEQSLHTKFEWKLEKNKIYAIHFGCCVTSRNIHFVLLLKVCMCEIHCLGLCANVRNTRTWFRPSFFPSSDNVICVLCVCVRFFLFSVGSRTQRCIYMHAHRFSKLKSRHTGKQTMCAPDDRVHGANIIVVVFSMCA